MSEHKHTPSMNKSDTYEFSTDFELVFAGLSSVLPLDVRYTVRYVNGDVDHLEVDKMDVLYEEFELGDLVSPEQNAALQELAMEHFLAERKAQDQAIGWMLR